MQTINDLRLYTFPSLLKNSVEKFSDRPALSLVTENPITYKQLSEQSMKLTGMLQDLNLGQYKKIIIFGTGMPQWGISYFSIVNQGAIAVPLLPDFSTTEVQAIIEHCGIDGCIIAEKQIQKIKPLSNLLPVIIRMEDFALLKYKITTHQTDLKTPLKTLNDFSNQQPVPIHVAENDTASIIYTSGTTGRSKGVELSHKNLIWTAVQGQTIHRINKMDRCLSFLPISHVYEFTIDFTMQMLNGACVYYLGKPPVISILLPAFKKVQPTIICSVPMIMEKIFKNKVIPQIKKNKITAFLYTLRPLQILLHRIAGKSLKKSFGGYVNFFGIGGAKLDPKVERFLKDAKFPYAIGYGLTETSPLLAGSGPSITVPGTVGPIMSGVKLKILNPNPGTGIGEIIAKGPNVMKGYYKDKALTAAVFTTEKDSCGAGWFKTGDLGTLSKIKGQMRLSLKGRSKNMILGPGGENIYPEDIEFVLNQHPLVSESLIVEDDNGLVALVQIDEEKLKEETENRLEEIKNGTMKLQDAVKEAAETVRHNAEETSEKLIRDMAYTREQVLSEIQYFVNSRTNRTSRIGNIKQIESFQKTASQKIKRYLYDLRTNSKKKKK